MSKTSSAPQAAVESLLALIAEERPYGAYYHGNADLGLLRALVSALPPGAVQVMELGESISDAQRIEFYRHGVMFWSEGGHPADLSVRDTTFHADQLRSIIEFHGRRPPRLFFLIGDATLTPQHDGYAWAWSGECLIGRRINDSAQVPQSRENDRIQRIAATREYLRGSGYAIALDEIDREMLAETNEHTIAAGTPQVTSPAWSRLPAEERERRERGATLTRHRLANHPFYGERAKKWGGDQYWAELYDGFND